MNNDFIFVPLDRAEVIEMLKNLVKGLPDVLAYNVVHEQWVSMGNNLDDVERDIQKARRLLGALKREESKQSLADQIVAAVSKMPPGTTSTKEIPGFHPYNCKMCGKPFEATNPYVDTCLNCADLLSPKS